MTGCLAEKRMENQDGKPLEDPKKGVFFGGRPNKPDI